MSRNAVSTPFRRVLATWGQPGEQAFERVRGGGSRSDQRRVPSRAAVRLRRAPGGSRRSTWPTNTLRTVGASSHTVLAAASMAQRHSEPSDTRLVLPSCSDAEWTCAAPTRFSAAVITGYRAIEATGFVPRSGVKSRSSNARLLPLSGVNGLGSDGALLPSGRTTPC